MSKVNHVLCLIILVCVTGCKTSPSSDLVQTPQVGVVDATNNDSSPDEASPEVKAGVISSAETESTESELTEYNVQPGQFNFYPRETSGRDTSGWSIITPSDDSRLIYVSSSSGDDNSAEFYAPRDIAEIEAPGLIKPFKTIEAANSYAREGFPDWILLHRGDVWEVSEAVKLRGGRSVDERSVFSSYGPSLERPKIVKSGGKEILRVWAETRFVSIVGISFYGVQRDPLSNDFSGWGNVKELQGILLYSGADHEDRMGSVLIEDNRFNYLSKAISSTGGAEHVDIVIRRNVITNSYHELGHSQGMSASNTSALLEENVFDHNGWLTQQSIRNGTDRAKGQATMFNHNTYFEGAMNTIFRNNIFLRPSSIHNKWTANPKSDLDEIVSHDLVMENNIYVGGEIAISAGGNDDNDNGYRWENIEIIDNIMMAIGRDQPTNRKLGWNIDATDWLGGQICGNYVLHTDNPLVTNVYGIKLSGHSSNITISKNTIHGLNSLLAHSENAGISILDSSPKTGITVSQNNVQLANSNMRVIITKSLNSVVFENNKYYSGLDSTEWFSSEDVDHDIVTWQSVSDDITSIVVEDNFLEPKRTFETYLNSIGIVSIDAFIQSIIDQPIRTWDENFSIPKISAYIRQGYGNTFCRL